MKAHHAILVLAFLFGPVALPQPPFPVPDRSGQPDRAGDSTMTRKGVADAAAFAADHADKSGAATAEEGTALDAKPPARDGASGPESKPAPAIPGAMFRRVGIPGFTDIAEGNNGIALADLNHDGLVDIVATYTEPKRGLSASGHHLRVFVNQGELRFRPHAIRIWDSPLTAAEFGRNPEIPNVADFNGDGLLDIFITRTSPMLAGRKLPFVEATGNTLLLSDGVWDTFRDVSAKLGARNEEGYNRQTSIADVNRDGWLDVAVGCDNIGNAIGGLPHSRLYVFKPNGTRFEDGRFQDIGGTPLVPDFGGFHRDSAKDKAGPGITLRDLDNDGDLDLVQSFHCDVRQPLLPYSPGEYRQGVFCWKNLLAETGTLRFEKVTGNGLACEARLKYDRDEELHEPVGQAPGLPYLFFADVDNDGLQDVLAIGPSDPGWAPRAEDVGGRFWRNLGHFQFKEATSAAGLDALNWTYRQWYRFFDVAIPPAAETWKPRSPTYPSQPGRKQRHPLDDRFYFANAMFGDFDNDGWLDLVVLDRHEQPTRPDYRAALFLNRGDGTFEVKPTTFSGLDSTGISGESADLNNDGRLDIVIACDPDNSGGGLAGVGPERYHDKVYVNTGAPGAQANHWLRLRFSGLKDAELIGARVEVTAAGRKQSRWIHSNHSYKSGGALDAHFGLGQATSAEVKVTLLDGTTRTFPATAADQVHTLALGQR